VASNIEWKARCREPGRQRELAQGLAAGPPELLEQADTFFVVPHGRLKLRRLAADRGELISYDRPDQAGPKQSTYTLTPTTEPELLRRTLAQVLGVRGEVRKRRWLYRAGQSRLHFDEVERLGVFLEVEVVLQPGQSVAEGERLADQLRHALDVRTEDLVAQAYIDLLTSPSPDA
jgi:adenylate cyclase class IV